MDNMFLSKVRQATTSRMNTAWCVFSQGPSDRILFYFILQMTLCSQSNNKKNLNSTFKYYLSQKGFPSFWWIDLCAKQLYLIIIITAFLIEDLIDEQGVNSVRDTGIKLIFSPGALLWDCNFVDRSLMVLFFFYFILFFFNKCTHCALAEKQAQ